MAINRDVKGMCYSDYEHLLMAEDVLEQPGYSTAHHLLHNVISDVNAEIEMVYFNNPELRKLANTIEEASRDFRHILVHYSAWRSCEFDSYPLYCHFYRNRNSNNITDYLYIRHSNKLHICKTIS